MSAEPRRFSFAASEADGGRLIAARLRNPRFSVLLGIEKRCRGSGSACDDGHSRLVRAISAVEEIAIELRRDHTMYHSYAFRFQPIWRNRRRGCHDVLQQMGKRRILKRPDRSRCHSYSGGCPHRLGSGMPDQPALHQVNIQITRCGQLISRLNTFSQHRNPSRFGVLHQPADHV